MEGEAPAEPLDARRGRVQPNFFHNQATLLLFFFDMVKSTQYSRLLWNRSQYPEGDG